MATNPILISLWYQALECEIGIAIEVPDRKRVQRELYVARQGHGDQDLWDVIMFMPPNQSEIWLCRKDADER